MKEKRVCGAGASAKVRRREIVALERQSPPSENERGASSSTSLGNVTREDGEKAAEGSLHSAARRATIRRGRRSRAAPVGMTNRQPGAAIGRASGEICAWGVRWGGDGILGAE